MSIEILQKKLDMHNLNQQNWLRQIGIAAYKNDIPQMDIIRGCMQQEERKIDEIIAQINALKELAI